MARDTWIWVNGTQVFLDAAELRKGRLAPADPDVAGEQCGSCGDDIFDSGKVDAALGGERLSVSCACGAPYRIYRR